MRVSQKFFTSLCVLAIFGAPTLVAKENVVLADAEFGSYEVSFFTYVPDAQHLLRVSCDSGEYFQQKFEAGDLPVFSAVDSEGYVLPDGGCAYELRTIPLIEGMDGPDGEAFRQFGGFSISDGRLAQPEGSARGLQR